MLYNNRIIFILYEMRFLLYELLSWNCITYYYTFSEIRTYKIPFVYVSS